MINRSESQNVSSSSIRLLTKILRMLVEEYGATQVLKSLEGIAEENSESIVNALQKTMPARRRKKLTAIQLVMKNAAENEKLTALLDLAERFEKKRFLPSLIHIREFLQSVGSEHTRLKDRSTAFSIVLKELMKLSPEQIDDLISSAAFHGPSELAVISEAIKAAADNLGRLEGEANFGHDQNDQES